MDALPGAPRSAANTWSTAPRLSLVHSMARKVLITTPAYLALEAYAGFEQRGGFKLHAVEFSGSRPTAYRAGIARASGSAKAPSFFQESKLAPACKLFPRIEPVCIFLHSRFTYRKVINRDAV